MRDIIDENSRKEGRNRSRLPKFTTEEIDLLKGWFAKKKKSILTRTWKQNLSLNFFRFIWFFLFESLHNTFNYSQKNINFSHLLSRYECRIFSLEWLSSKERPLDLSKYLNYFKFYNLLFNLGNFFKITLAFLIKTTSLIIYYRLFHGVFGRCYVGLRINTTILQYS